MFQDVLASAVSAAENSPPCRDSGYDVGGEFHVRGPMSSVVVSTARKLAVLPTIPTVKGMEAVLTD